MKRYSYLTVATMLAMSGLSGGETYLQKPRKGTSPNPERQSKAEKKRAKRRERNRQLIGEDLRVQEQEPSA